MKKTFLFLLVFLAAGCQYASEKLKHPLDEPVERWVIDDNYQKYQKNLEMVERQYVDKEITYSEYLKKKKELEEKYTREVEKRNEKLRADPSGMGSMEGPDTGF